MGDRTAQQQLEQEFTRTAGAETRRLFAIAYSILRDRHEADDAVQETMMQAWRSWEKARNREQPGPWLTRICVNHCVRRRGLLRRRWNTISYEDAADVARAPAPFTGHMLDLDAAYRKLSVQQRAVVALTYHHGYTVDESAALMGCAPGTARSHLARALATLRRELGDA